MVGSDEATNWRLRQIADILGVPVEAFADAGTSGDVVGLNELVNLCLTLKTQTGRSAALNALRRIRDHEKGGVT
ncbi:hypothetical protein FF100_31775 [Methylobacterium terricola]|uniref:Uncharacterized protein n=1 Tax=Methylobacterium terricola TaxID=2583531 RepID=A0A5C4L721_9HYPH|nr:hypothetical protein [Methylobacterium terricola]TNC07658.1 hypothetical protein FF100_31775 [Methylobacterium terricola]